MKHVIPEFSRPLAVDRVPRGGSFEKITANPKECQAVAARLNVLALHAFSAELRATPWRGGGLKLEGKLNADVEQISVVSLEAVRNLVEFPVLRYFLHFQFLWCSGFQPDAVSGASSEIPGATSDCPVKYLLATLKFAAG